MYILSMLIALFATLIGSIFGIGGGVIIKPALEAVLHLPLAQINALSGVTVLCMAAVSLFRYLKGGEKLNAEVIWLSAGAVSGGFLGKYLFDLMNLAVPEANAKVVQYSLLILLLIAALFKNRLRSFRFHNAAALTLVGLFMGALSAFLGIGGGPINLLAIYLVLKLDAKQAAVYSVVVILLSQAASMCVSSATGGFAKVDMSLLYAMIPAAIAGGLLGPTLHKKWNLSLFERNYNYLLLGLVALNVYTIARLILA